MVVSLSPIESTACASPPKACYGRAGGRFRLVVPTKLARAAG